MTEKELEFMVVVPRRGSRSAGYSSLHGGGGEVCVCVCVELCKTFLQAAAFSFFCFFTLLCSRSWQNPTSSASGDDLDLVWPENICCKCPEAFVGGGRFLKVSIFRFSEVSS